MKRVSSYLLDHIILGGHVIMAFNFPNLDEKTRQSMLDELNYDIQHDSVYISSRLNTHGEANYILFLKQAISNGNETSLCNTLAHNCLNSTENRKKSSGGYTIAKVPSNANEVLAEGEFNRYYIRALCLQAISESRQLKIYRAKSVRTPRIESQQQIGQFVLDPNKLLQDLRTHMGVDPALHLPPGPNSGLSVQLI